MLIRPITIGCTPSDVGAFEFVSHLRRRVILDVITLGVYRAADAANTLRWFETRMLTTALRTGSKRSQETDFQI